METKRVDIFGSFLRAAAAAPEEGLPPPAEGAATPASAPDLEKAVLTVLAGSQDAVDVKELIGRTQGGPTQVLQILQEMEKVGLVQRAEGENAGQKYAITALGRDIASAG